MSRKATANIRLSNILPNIFEEDEDNNNKRNFNRGTQKLSLKKNKQDDDLFGLDVLRGFDNSIGNEAKQKLKDPFGISGLNEEEKIVAEEIVQIEEEFETILLSNPLMRYLRLLSGFLNITFDFSHKFETNFVKNILQLNENDYTEIKEKDENDLLESFYTGNIKGNVNVDVDNYVLLDKINRKKNKIMKKIRINNLEREIRILQHPIFTEKFMIPPEVHSLSLLCKTYVNLMRVNFNLKALEFEDFLGEEKVATIFAYTVSNMISEQRISNGSRFMNIKTTNKISGNVSRLLSYLSRL